jgi:hypothetical protein
MGTHLCLLNVRNRIFPPGLEYIPALPSKNFSSGSKKMSLIHLSTQEVSAALTRAKYLSEAAHILQVQNADQPISRRTKIPYPNNLGLKIRKLAPSNSSKKETDVLGYPLVLGDRPEADHLLQVPYADQPVLPPDRHVLARLVARNRVDAPHVGAHGVDLRKGRVGEDVHRAWTAQKRSSAALK